MLFDWNKGWKRNTHKLGRKASCERWFGTSMCHQRSKILCGGQCPIFYWREITCIGEEWLWRVPASSTANTLKRKLTYCGSAPLPTMFGRWLEEECRNSATMREIFSSSSSWCKRNWHGRRWNSGALQLGRYGTQGTKPTFKMFSHNPKWYMKGPLSCLLHTKPSRLLKQLRDWGKCCLFGVCFQGYGGVRSAYFKSIVFLGVKQC